MKTALQDPRCNECQDRVDPRGKGWCHMFKNEPPRCHRMKDIVNKQTCVSDVGMSQLSVEMLQKQIENGETVIYVDCEHNLPKEKKDA